jgi:hypothetical protein
MRQCWASTAGVLRVRLHSTRHSEDSGTGAPACPSPNTAHTLTTTLRLPVSVSQHRSPTHPTTLLRPICRAWAAWWPPTRACCGLPC